MSDDVERDAIRAEGCTASELARNPVATQKPHLRAVPADAGYLDVVTPLVRGFLGMPDDEPTELTFFYEGRVWIAHATDVTNHVRLLREAQQIRGFNGAYQLVNGPMDSSLLARYEPNQIGRAWNGRVTDDHISTRRAVFLDLDPVRAKGISATDAQFGEARDVTDKVEAFLAEALGGDGAIGRGCSGNGFFLLIAIEPRPVPKKSEPDPDGPRISAFLKALEAKFGIPGRVKIDQAVANAARLMPSPGTLKAKGRNTPERPHRQTSFCCRANVKRVRLEDLT